MNEQILRILLALAEGGKPVGVQQNAVMPALMGLGGMQQAAYRMSPAMLSMMSGVGANTIPQVFSQ